MAEEGVENSHRESLPGLRKVEAAADRASTAAGEDRVVVVGGTRVGVVPHRHVRGPSAGCDARERQGPLAGTIHALEPLSPAPVTLGHGAAAPGLFGMAIVAGLADPAAGHRDGGAGVGPRALGLGGIPDHVVVVRAIEAKALAVGAHLSTAVASHLACATRDTRAGRPLLLGPGRGTHGRSTESATRGVVVQRQVGSGSWGPGGAVIGHRRALGEAICDRANERTAGGRWWGWVGWPDWKLGNVVSGRRSAKGWNRWN